jgi:hypothetical protein
MAESALRRPSGGRGRRRPYSRLSLIENAERISLRVRVIHRQIDKANTSPADPIPPPPPQFLSRHLRVLAMTDPSGVLLERRSPVLNAELVHVQRLSPHNAWAWLLTRLVDGPYVTGHLLARKRLRGAARALFSRLPP